MAEEQELVAPPEEEKEETLQPSFPAGRIKRIVKLDLEIGKLTSEAVMLISESAELFIQFLAERSAQVALEKKRKTIKLEHIRIAVKKHRPTSDFLLDELPLPSQPLDSDRPAKDRGQSSAGAGKNDPVVRGKTRLIDSFFRKPGNGASNGGNGQEDGGSEPCE